MAAPLEQNQFDCSICMTLFNDPVSTPCGHNFCKSCIDAYWDVADLCRCPLCMETFDSRPELRINTSFRKLLEHFKSLKRNDDLVAKPGEVACDICMGRKLKALKSCLVCLTSYCESHLEPHQRVSTLKTHKLIDPVENLENRMCVKHQRRLERFCRDDQSFVCHLCCETDHKHHQVVSLEAESTLKMTETERYIEEMKQDWQKRIQEICNSSEKHKKSAQIEMNASFQVFTNIIELIKRCQNELIEEIEERLETEEKRLREIITNVEQEMTELQKRSNELEQLLQTEDHFNLLQKCIQTQAMQDTKKWLNIPIHQVEFMNCARIAVRKVQDFIAEEIGKLSAVEMERIKTFAVDVTIDPWTAGPWVVVSEDRKQVRKSPQKLNVPDNPERFTEDVCCLAEQGFSSGRHYWEVKVQDKLNWVLGVAVESLERKGFILLSPESGHWTIGHRDGKEYFAFLEMSLNLTPQLPLHKVGVYLDYEEGQVSFYNVGTKSHIFTFSKNGFKGRIYPMFDPCISVDREEALPLQITYVEM